MVGSRARDRVELARPRNIRQKLRDHKSLWRLLDVLPERPPAEVVHPFKIYVRALKKGDILLQPSPCRFVVDVVGVSFYTVFVERLDVMTKTIRIQNCRLPL